MEKPKLNPDDLAVTSFATSGDDGTDPIQPVPSVYIYTCTNDPTAQTWCFICPPATHDCEWA